MRRSPKSDTALDDLTALGRAVRQLHAARGGADSWVTLDLTMAQLKAFVLLVGSGGTRSGDLAAKLGVGPSAVTPIVDRLLELELAVRDFDSADRRIVWVRPTARARDLYNHLLQASREVLAEILDEIPASERAAVADALAQLARAAGLVLQRSETTVPA